MKMIFMLFMIGMCTAIADDVVVGTAGGPPSSHPLCGS